MTAAINSILHLPIFLFVLLALMVWVGWRSVKAKRAKGKSGLVYPPKDG